MLFTPYQIRFFFQQWCSLFSVPHFLSLIFCPTFSVPHFLAHKIKALSGIPPLPPFHPTKTPPHATNHPLSHKMCPTKCVPQNVSHTMKKAPHATNHHLSHLNVSHLFLYGFGWVGGRELFFRGDFPPRPKTAGRPGGDFSVLFRYFVRISVV